MTQGITQTNPEVESPLFMFAGGFAFGVGTTLVLLAVAGSAIEAGRVSLTGLLAFEAATALLGAAVFSLLVGSFLFVLSFRRNRRRLEEAMDRKVS